MSEVVSSCRRRQRIVISLVIAVPALLAGIAHFWFGWPPFSHTTVDETAGGYDSESEPASLQEALAVAKKALEKIKRNVRDYSAVIVKKGRSGNKTTETVMFAKVREDLFSVYLCFLTRRNDTRVKGREVIYADGRNEGKLLVHSPGIIAGRLGTMALDPNGWLATSGERHPITEIGLANLCRQLIQRGEATNDPGHVQVRRFPHARINTRACTLLEITYPAGEPKIEGYLARVFVDNQWQLPIRVGVYELPRDRSKGPQLVEEYTYLNLKLNNGHGDADFDPKNPQYHFP
jgi:hypothetical protein